MTDRVGSGNAGDRLRLGRRDLLRLGATGAAALGLAGPLEALAAASPRLVVTNGYGALGDVKDARDGKVRLRLPSGFSYRTFHKAGRALADGTLIPKNHDGMGAFTGKSRKLTLLVRNHEIDGRDGAFGDVSKAFDPLAGGGTVTVEVDAYGVVSREWVSLNGTLMNCSGGRTPWRTWLSGEETVNGYDVLPDFSGTPNGHLRRHGYVFEVPVDGESNRVPIRSMGRFQHEAAVYEPALGHVYMTEDNQGAPSGLYRYIPPKQPDTVGRIADGGQLQMLRIVGTKRADLTGPLKVGTTFACDWVKIAEPDPTFNKATYDVAASYVGEQGRALGAALFARLEGATYRRGVVYFVSTTGGVMSNGDPPGYGHGRGQLWAYTVSSSTLRLVYQSPRQTVLDMPDAVTVSPQGSLLLCEDGDGDNFIRGLTQDGRLFTFARNVNVHDRLREFAGAQFSPDGTTLFVNLNAGDGYTMAIWGPWAQGPF